MKKSELLAMLKKHHWESKTVDLRDYGYEDILKIKCPDPINSTTFTNRTGDKTIVVGEDSFIVKTEYRAIGVRYKARIPYKECELKGEGLLSACINGDWIGVTI